QEAEIEDRHAVVVLVGGEAEVVEHVIGEGLVDVAAVELEGEEHDADPGADLVVELCACPVSERQCCGAGVTPTLLTSFFSSVSVHSALGSHRCRPSYSGMGS